MSFPFNVELTVNVVGGIGSVSFGAGIRSQASLFGTIKAVVIIVPAGPPPSFEWTLANLSGNIVAGSGGTQTGNTTAAEDMPLVGGGTFTILNATADGVYKIELVVDAAGIA